MSNLKTNLMGIKIDSPIIVGSSELPLNITKLKQLEEFGAGAVVFKTLFEEQIQMERLELDELLTLYDDRNAEMGTLFPKVEHAGPVEHIMQLKNAVDAVKMPIIASLNCVYEVSWVEYAQKLADTGAAALELNFYDTPKKMDRTAEEIETMQSNVITAVKNKTNLPIQVKLSRYYTNPLNAIKQFENAGADGFVLFNKLFLPTINPDDESFYLDWDYSSESEKLYAFRFAGLLHNRIESSISTNTGIYNHQDIAAMILAGADTVQMVSAIYKNGPSYIKTVLENLSSWMDEKGYQDIDSFKGKISFLNQKEKSNYTRSQYVDILLNNKPNFFKERF